MPYKTKEQKLVYNRRYQQEHKKQIHAKLVAYIEKLKTEVFSHYSKGAPICAGCGITNIDILTIDHINGNGCQHRKELNLGGGRSFYRWLIKENYPTGYQVLCYNCNILKYRQQLREGKNSAKRILY